ncbi:hypothetical protein [Salmonirosea aquatica]|uniref:Uncharacterized protein n=1 Tax=Salmonirosea aquatica TaxID=2654236 RepID=A0A7C9BGT0_9BACT|nr:hypothetical protein [Cytophagaceae bacterium SJW1-29]
MENLKSFLSLCLGGAILWHGIIVFLSETKLVDIFQVQPAPGYTWDIADPGIDDFHWMSTPEGVLPSPPSPEMSETHYFWEKNKVTWRPGMFHPEFNVVAIEETGKWRPLPGYKFANDKNGDLNTVWQSGLLHPNFKVVSVQQEGSWKPLPGYKFVNNDNLETTWEPGQVYPGYNAWATEKEGLWMPVVGYKFVIENGLWTDVVWNPGQKYDELKVQSGEQKDSYIPYPGYKFVNPGVDLEVAWTPGLPHSNPDYANYVASNSEGSWELRTQPVEPTASDYFMGWFVKGLASAGIKKVFGDNPVSDVLLRESTKDGLRGIGEVLKK